VTPSGKSFPHGRGRTLPWGRPALIELWFSEQITIGGDLLLLDAPYIHLHMFYSRHIVIDGIFLQSSNTYTGSGTDGLDIDSCSDVVIRNAVLDGGDDNIALKSGLNWWGRKMCDYWTTGLVTTAEHCSGMPTKDVMVEDSLLLQGHGASIGSETSGGISNVTFRRIAFNHTEFGIRIKTARGRGNTIQGVVYGDISMTNVGTGITIESYYPSDTPMQQINASNTPIVTGVELRRVVGTNLAVAFDQRGLPESPSRKVLFEDVELSVAPAGRRGDCNPWASVTATNVSDPGGQGNCSLGWRS
jgi:polygalacturonase